MRVTSTLPVLLVACFLSTGAEARSWYADPSVFLSVGYVEDPLLQGEPDEGTSPVDRTLFDQQFFQVGTDIRFATESPVDLIGLDISAVARRYDVSELDSEFLHGGFIYSRRGERHEFLLETGASSDSTIETEFLDTGRFENNVDRNEFYFSPSVTAQFSQTLAGEFGVSYRDVEFDTTDPGAVTDLVDYQEVELNATLTRRATERLDVLAIADVLFYSPEVASATDTDEDSYSLSLGLAYQLSPQLDLSASVGRSKIESDFVLPDSTGAQRSDEETIFNVGAVYAGQVSQFELEGYRSIEASAVGGLAPVDGVRLYYVYSVSPRLDFTFGADYATRDSVPGESEEREYYSLSPGAIWNYNEKFSLEFDIEYRDQETTDVITGAHEEADSTQYLLTARYRFGRKWINP